MHVVVACVSDRDDDEEHEDDEDAVIDVGFMEIREIHTRVS